MQDKILRRILLIILTWTGCFMFGWWSTLLIPWMLFVEMTLLYYRVLSGWLFAWEYFQGMTQCFLQKQNFNTPKVRTIMKWINITICIVFFLLSIVRGYFFFVILRLNETSWENALTFFLDNQPIYSFFLTFQVIFQLLTLIALFIGIFLAFRDLRRKKQATKYDDPISLNLPNFIIHAIILIGCLICQIWNAYGQYKISDVLLKDLNSWQFYDLAQTKKTLDALIEISKLKTVEDYTQAVIDLFVLVVLW